MTLIAGFKCRDGYVFCADSQETVREPDGSEYRRTCQKLVPIKIGSVDVSIAGSGDGNLIEAFVEHLRVKYQASSIENIESIPTVIKEETFAFAKSHGIGKAKVGNHFRFMFGAYSSVSATFGAWKTAAGDPVEVQSYSLVGFEDSRYDYATRNYYHPDMPISQGVSLGLYLMWIGEQTSNCIKNPITVAVITRAGVQFQEQGKINRLDQKVRLFTSQFERQFLACSDVGLHNDTFARNFKEFGKTIVQFRNDYVAEWTEKAFERGLDRMCEPWNEIPTGTVIVAASGPKIEQSIIDQQRRASESLRQTHSYVQDQERIEINLQTLRGFMANELEFITGSSPNPLSEQGTKFHEALTEIGQAVMIGPMPLRPDFCNLLNRVMDVMLCQMDLNEQKDQDMHKACVEMRNSDHRPNPDLFEPG